jgi:N-acetylglucosamine malate deacetylase 1
MNILILAAHPDDETLGCGATIAKMSQNGDSVHLLTFTNGISARDNYKSNDRRHSVEKVCEILGIKNFETFNFPDNEMDSVPLLSVVKKIEKYIEKNSLNPDIVFTHSPYCLNIDHKIVSKATTTVFRGLSRFAPIKILSYEVPSSSEWNPISSFTPNVYYDVGHTYKSKMKALSVYSDEMREHPHPRSKENCKRLMKVYGAECGLDMAERFMILREVIK